MKKFPRVTVDINWCHRYVILNITMSTKCENCNVLLEMEDDRIKWYKELSRRNIELLNINLEQQDLILILKEKLQEKQNVLETERMTKSVAKAAEQQIIDFMSSIKKRNEQLKEAQEENEKFYLEHVAYLNEIADFFREKLFDELAHSNRLKRCFVEKFNRYRSTEFVTLLEKSRRDREETIKDELKFRYRNAIRTTEAEMKRQSELISGMWKHNRNLYSIIRANKKESEEKLTTKEKEMADLKSTITTLKKRNEHLYMQIKLEVEGCQRDIFDARKRLLCKKKMAD